MKERHPFDVELQEKVAHHTTPVSPSLWEKIEGELEPEHKIAYYPMVRWAVAAVFLIGIGLFRFYPTGTNQSLDLPIEEENTEVPISYEEPNNTDLNPRIEIGQKESKSLDIQNAESTLAQVSKTKRVEKRALSDFEREDEAEDIRAFAEATLSKEDLNIEKSGYFTIEIGKAEDLIAKLETPTTYGEELKIYAARSMNQVFEGESMQAPPAPKGSIEELKAKWNSITTAIPKGLFSAKSIQPKQ